MPGGAFRKFILIFAWRFARTKRQALRPSPIITLSQNGYGALGGPSFGTWAPKQATGVFRLRRRLTIFGSLATEPTLGAHSPTTSGFHLVEKCENALGVQPGTNNLPPKNVEWSPTHILLFPATYRRLCGKIQRSRHATPKLYTIYQRFGAFRRRDGEPRPCR